MKPNTTATGRPAIGINPKRLLQLRKEKRLTQLALIEGVYQELGKSTIHSSPETLKTTYRRWEKTGRIDPKAAEALAKVLGITMAVLQGGAPDAAPSRLQAIQDHIHQQIQAGHQELQKMLDAELAAPVLHIAIGGSSSAPAEHRQERQFAQAQLARDLAKRLEYAQLSQDKEELETLSRLLGYDRRGPSSFHVEFDSEN